MEVKDERALFPRCLIVERSRPDVDVRETLGRSEFSSYTRSLCDRKGDLLPTLDKSEIMSTLEGQRTAETDVDDCHEDLYEDHSPTINR